MVSWRNEREWSGCQALQSDEVEVRRDFSVLLAGREGLALPLCRLEERTH